MRLRRLLRKSEERCGIRKRGKHSGGLAAASPRFNNLSPISGYAERLRLHFDNTSRSQRGRIRKAGDRRRATRQLLAFSRKQISSRR